MIGKIVKGATFRGCVNYVLNKKEAHLLAADGLLTDSVENIILGFDTQRRMKPNIK